MEKKYKMTSDADYQMRGHRVHPFKQDEIEQIAESACRVVKLRRSSFRAGRAEKLVSRLEDCGIYVDVVQDEQWLGFTRATVDPQKGMIYMPAKLYSQLCRGQAEAIRIFLHELGHIFLCHKPLLHFTEVKPTKECDSEWQADLFADSVIAQLGLQKVDRQLELQI